MTSLLMVLVVAVVTAGLVLVTWEFLLARRVPRDLSQVGIGLSLGLATYAAAAVTGRFRWNDGVMLAATLMGAALGSVLLAWVLRRLRWWNRAVDRA